MAITTRSDIMTRLAQGKGALRPLHTAKLNASGSGDIGAGMFSLTASFNGIGSTLPGTRVSLPSPPTTSELFQIEAIHMADPDFREGWLGRFYELGTVNFAATGNQFTHASTFTQLRRTIFGAANLPITMIPLLYITTSITTTAPNFRLNTVAAGAGYVNQDGNNVVGTLDFLFPFVPISSGSVYWLMLELGDSSIQNISAIQTTIAGAAGAATVIGFEPLSLGQSPMANCATYQDNLFSGYGMQDLTPAVPDSGSVVSYIGYLLQQFSLTSINGMTTSVSNA